MYSKLYRILVENVQKYKDSKSEVDWHIKHKYTEEMSQKSDIVISNFTFPIVVHFVFTLSYPFKIIYILLSFYPHHILHIHVHVGTTWSFPS